MSLPSYPSYTDSGREWPPTVPAHWGVAEIKRFASFVYGDALPQDARSHDGEVPVYGSNGVFGRHNLANTGAPVILIGRKGSFGALNWCTTRAFAIDTVYFVDVEHCCADLRWFFWALHTAGLDTSSQDTGVPGLSRSYAHSTALPLPPLPEQKAIAAFLDRETGKIDALVEEQRRLIELLKEKRQAVISHSVTKGLNPDAPMKPSGIEWLGDVPEHWSTGKLRHLSNKIVDGAHFTPTYVDEGVPFLRVTDISSGPPDMDKVRRIPANEHAELIKRCHPKKGDLLLSKNGTIGIPRVVTWDWPFSVFVSLCVIKLQRELDAFFACYVFLSKSIEVQIKEDSKQSTVTNLHMEKISGFRFPLPPLGEQRDIVRFLDAKMSKLDGLISEAEAAITLLQERRSALISAAVMGKIDVQGMVPADTEAA